MTIKIQPSFAAVLVLAASSLTAHAGSVSVYLSAPFTGTAGSSGLNTSDGTATGTANNPNTTPNTLGISGTSTETFSQTAATYKTLTSTLIPATFATPGAGFTINANGQYGGGNQGNYLGVTTGNDTTITFTSPVGYFGLLWCAVDAGNSLSLYDQNNALLGTFNSSSFTQILGAGTTVTALNGKTYNTADYFGQPTGTNAATPTTTTNRQNNGERYAFLNFVGTGGTAISKIVETETGATFESDNYAIRATAPTVDKNNNNSLVFVSAVPEPSVWAMIVAAGGLMMMTIGRRRPQL